MHVYIGNIYIYAIYIRNYTLLSIHLALYFSRARTNLCSSTQTHQTLLVYPMPMHHTCDIGMTTR